MTNPVVRVPALVALSTTAETSDRPIAGLLETGTSKVETGSGRVVPPSGLSAGTRVSTMRVGDVVGTNSPTVLAGALAPV